MGIVVTVEDIEVGLGVMIFHIVGHQGARHIEVAGIIHHGTRPMVEGLGGKGPDHFHILHMVALIGGMLVDLGDALLSLIWSLKMESKYLCNGCGTFDYQFVPIYVVFFPD